MKTHISASLDKDVVDKMNQFCKAEERPRSWVITKALVEFLQDRQDIEIAYERMQSPKKKIITSKALRSRLGIPG